MEKWQLQTAKAKMSELVKKAQSAPQEITLHGKSAAVVLSREEFDRLSGRNVSLVEFMRQSPWADIPELEITRDKSLTREVSF